MPADSSIGVFSLIVQGGSFALLAWYFVHGLPKQMRENREERERHLDAFRQERSLMLAAFREERVRMLEVFSEQIKLERERFDRLHHKSA